MAGGRPVLEVQPQHVPVKVIEQVLVTSVKTRPLTLDEIRAKGIVLDSDDYYAFEFTLGLKLESKAVNITFPVVFDREGVPIPQFILPPPPPTRQADLPPLPTIVPVLFEVDEGPEGPRARPAPAADAERRRRDPHPERHHHPRQRRLPEAVLLGQALRGERGPGGFGPERARRHRDASRCRRATD